jgi:hypothetical protein
MACLNRDAAKWQLYELDGCSETFERADCGDSGNIVTRLVRAVDIADAFTRFAASITRIQSSAPECEVHVDSPSEIILRRHGLGIRPRLHGSNRRIIPQ